MIKFERENIKVQSDIRGIYFLINKGKIVYISYSETDINKGILKHTEDKVFDEWNYIEYPDIKMPLNNVLADLIIKMSPIYNSGLPSNTLWVSQTYLKKHFGINKIPFKKIVKKYNIENYTFNGRIYVSYPQFKESMERGL